MCGEQVMLNCDGLAGTATCRVHTVTEHGADVRAEYADFLKRKAQIGGDHGFSPWKEPLGVRNRTMALNVQHMETYGQQV